MDWLTHIHGGAGVQAPEFSTGDDVRVWFKFREQEKERISQFEGVVLRVRGRGQSRTFTVRRLTHGEGVERVFPMDARTINRVEVLRRGKVNRSRIYFLRHVVKRTRLATLDAPSAGAQGGPASERAEETAAPVRPEGIADAMVESDKPAVKQSAQP